ncbi:MAG: transglycosylase domain-containing protein, partial [Pseudomonadota bacterium]
MSRTPKSKKPLVAERRYPAKTAAPKRQTRPKRARKAGRRRPWPVRLVRWMLALFWSITWRGTVVAAVFVGLAALYVALTLPPADTFIDQRARGSVTMTDRDGQVFAWRGDQFGGAMRAEAVSPHIRNALIATEDRRFYSHLGLSPRG